MKSLIVVLVFVSTLAAAPVLGNDDSDSGQGRGWCSLDGGWYGSSGLGSWTWIATMTSPYQAVGTAVWSGGLGTWFGYCPDSVRYSTGQGVATRTGPRSFEFTIVTFSYNADGDVACIWKNSGWVELDRGCETGALNAQVQLFNPDQNPFGDETPFICFSEGPDNIFERMTVDPLDPTCP